VNVDDMEARLEITMNIRSWKELQNQLVSKYPSWKLSEAISKLIRQATKHFNEEVEGV
jgi:hypothetical protein